MQNKYIKMLTEIILAFKYVEIMFEKKELIHLMKFQSSLSFFGFYELNSFLISWCLFISSFCINLFLSSSKAGQTKIWWFSSPMSSFWYIEHFCSLLLIWYHLLLSIGSEGFAKYIYISVNANIWIIFKFQIYLDFPVCDSFRSVQDSRYPNLF